MEECVLLSVRASLLSDKLAIALGTCSCELFEGVVKGGDSLGRDNMVNAGDKELGVTRLAVRIEYKEITLERRRRHLSDSDGKG